METTIRPMTAQDLEAADRVLRLAFGTEFGLPDPMRFLGDADLLRPRWHTHPTGCLIAEAGGEILGSVAVMDWGSLAVLGPLSVRPDCWNRGLARRLLAAALSAAEAWGARRTALYTQPSSPRHLRLYEEGGFLSRHLIAVMARPVEAATSAAPPLLFSQLQPERQDEVLSGCRRITGAALEGLDLSREIRATAAQRLGDTILLEAGGAIIGFALYHTGPGSEAGSGTLALRFAAVRPGDAAGFQTLLAAVAAQAARCGARRLQASVTHARRDAYAMLKAEGFRTELSGVAMTRPDADDYDARESLILEEWR
ncbi:MAG TPA: GNAT family N-acetyltransferase [Roseomonas sp.]|nr:GNAT family N-acetyltransferase [Roseomonas sp.]